MVAGIAVTTGVAVGAGVAVGTTVGVGLGPGRSLPVSPPEQADNTTSSPASDTARAPVAKVMVIFSPLTKDLDGAEQGRHES